MLRLPVMMMAAIGAIGAIGCGTLPDAPVERALYFDLRSVVETQSRVDWVVDEDELDELASAIMTSACQTPAPSRRALRSWIDLRLADAGGSAQAVWAANAQDLSEAREPLMLERTRAALDYGEQRIESCPFWLLPDPEFDGVQGNTDRLVFFAESMGSGQIVIQDGDVTVGGTGLARLLPAWGVTERLTIGLGAEMGVASTFPRTESGGRSVKPVFTGGIPILIQVLDGTLRYDLDLAAVTRASRNEIEGLRFGGRVGFGIGVATPRIAGVMPYIVAWTGYELLAAGAGEPTTHILRGGTRVGINWDP